MRQDESWPIRDGGGVRMMHRLRLIQMPRISQRMRRRMALGSAAALSTQRMSAFSLLRAGNDAYINVDALMFFKVFSGQRGNPCAADACEVHVNRNVWLCAVLRPARLARSAAMSAPRLRR